MTAVDEPGEMRSVVIFLVWTSLLARIRGKPDQIGTFVTLANELRGFLEVNGLILAIELAKQQRVAGHISCQVRVIGWQGNGSNLNGPLKAFLGILHAAKTGVENAEIIQAGGDLGMIRAKFGLPDMHGAFD